MNIYGYPLLIMCLSLVITNYSVAMERDEEWGSSRDDRHENRPRLLGGFFSRPKPESEKQHGLGLKDHFGNVLKGGSIGFQGEIRPLAPIHDIIDTAKSFLPKPGGIIGVHRPGIGIDIGIHKPNGDKEKDPYWKEDKKGEYPDTKPKPDYYDEYPDTKPKPDEYDEEYSDTKPNPDKPKDWQPQNPKDVNTNGPRWEDIGEEPEDYKYDHTIVPIEEIIQPRIRTKRRIESKVFHVPVEFLSNAKPYLVKVASKNEMNL